MSWAASSRRTSSGQVAVRSIVGGAGRDPLVGEHADGVAQELLLLGQAHGAVAGLRGGHRGHPSSGIVSPDTAPWEADRQG